MISGPCRQILQYGRSDAFVKSHSEQILRQSYKLFDLLSLFRDCKELCKHFLRHPVFHKPAGQAVRDGIYLFMASRNDEFPVFHTVFCDLILEQRTEHPPAVRLDLTQRSGLGSGDVAGADAVALDIGLAVLAGDVLGQHLQAALGSSVGGNGLAAQLAHHGADVDDLAVTLLDHGGDHSLGYDERSVQVHVDHLTELGSAHVAHGDALDDAGVVHQNVDDTHFGLDLGHQGIHSLFIGDIAYIAVGLDAGLTISSQALVHQFLLDVVENDGGTCLAQSAGDGKADSVRSAGYQGNLALQRKHVHFNHS